MKRFALLMLVAMFLLVGCSKAKSCAKCGEGKPCVCKTATPTCCGKDGKCCKPAPATPATPKTDCAKCGIGKACTCSA